MAQLISQPDDGGLVCVHDLHSCCPLEMTPHADMLTCCALLCPQATLEKLANESGRRAEELAVLVAEAEKRMVDAYNAEQAAAKPAEAGEANTGAFPAKMRLEGGKMAELEAELTKQIVNNDKLRSQISKLQSQVSSAGGVVVD